jgi:hypothetical protein
MERSAQAKERPARQVEDKQKRIEFLKKKQGAGSQARFFC